MIGWLEITIVVVIVLLFVGYRRLPQIGRAAGEGTRSVIDRARGLSSKVGERVEDKVDPSTIGRSAGRSLREVREVRDALTGKEPPKEDEGSGGGSSAA
jgi:Sec-independent protein translocase protein TatA